MKSRISGGKRQVYDPARKRWVSEKPEELVRQAVIEYLVENLKVPVSLLGVEFSLSHFEPGNLRKVDIIVWKPGTRGGAVPLIPWLLVECKAPEVELSKALQYQVAGYLTVFPSRFLMLTNGSDSRYYRLEGNEYQEIGSLPLYA